MAILGPRGFLLGIPLSVGLRLTGNFLWRKIPVKGKPSFEGETESCGTQAKNLLSHATDTWLHGIFKDSPPPIGLP